MVLARRLHDRSLKQPRPKQINQSNEGIVFTLMSLRRRSENSNSSCWISQCNSAQCDIGRAVTLELALAAILNLPLIRQVKDDSLSQACFSNTSLASIKVCVDKDESSNACRREKMVNWRQACYETTIDADALAALALFPPK